MVSVFNLCSFIYTCLSHPAAKNTVALISDNEDVSTPELIKYIASAMCRKAHLLPCPPQMLKLLFGIAGQKALYSKLCCNLQIDISDHANIFGWTPDISVEKALAASFQ